MTYTETTRVGTLRYGVAEEQGHFIPVSLIEREDDYHMVPQGRQTTDRIAAVEASLLAAEDIRRLMS